MTCLLYVFFWLCHCTLVYKRSTFCNQFKLMNDTVKNQKNQIKKKNWPNDPKFQISHLRATQQFILFGLIRLSRHGCTMYYFSAWTLFEPPPLKVIWNLFFYCWYLFDPYPTYFQLYLWTLHMILVTNIKNIYFVFIDVLLFDGKSIY